MLICDISAVEMVRQSSKNQSGVCFIYVVALGVVTQSVTRSKNVIIFVYYLHKNPG